jgi:hypothetical protein
VEPWGLAALMCTWAALVERLCIIAQSGSGVAHRRLSSRTEQTAAKESRLLHSIPSKLISAGPEGNSLGTAVDECGVRACIS